MGEREKVEREGRKKKEGDEAGGGRKPRRSGHSGATVESRRVTVGARKGSATPSCFLDIFAKPRVRGLPATTARRERSSLCHSGVSRQRCIDRATAAMLTFTSWQYHARVYVCACVRVRSCSCMRRCEICVCGCAVPLFLCLDASVDVDAVLMLIPIRHHPLTCTMHHFSM